MSARVLGNLLAGVTIQPPALSPAEESRIRAWFEHILERDQLEIAEYLGRCKDDLDARRYFLERAKEVPDVTGKNHENSATTFYSGHARIRPRCG